MTKVVCHLNPANVPENCAPGEVHVLLYSGSPPHHGTGAIGGQLRDALFRFGVPPAQRAVDLLSIALAVTAADTFVLRDEAQNAWSRDLHLVVPLGTPATWDAVRGELERALGFLSGDNWTFEFVSGGLNPPASFELKNIRSAHDLTRVDCVSLFSGGLDSAVGALDLLRDAKRPLLVSHAYRGDADHQEQVAGFLEGEFQRFGVNAWPTRDGTAEVSMRTRSFNFVAFGVLAAQTRSSMRAGEITEFLIPENGLIALNAPLTPRRLGALSTRTTHPHYLASLQSILDKMGFSVRITNPYELLTKGEMTLCYRGRADVEKLVGATVSCGVWKRKNQQCGRCVPCLIRRASIYAANIDDTTSYECHDLQAVLASEDLRDDVIAMLTGVARLRTNDLERWVSQAGPLPVEPTRRQGLVDVHRRGMGEVRTFLQDSGFQV